MADSEWLQNLESAWTDALNLLTNIRHLNFKALSFKDYMTIVGLSFTAVKVLYMGWEVYDAFKEFGIARLVSPNLVKKYGKWAVMAGGEDAISEAYMKELAAGGVNIFIISHSPEALRPTAVFLEEKYKIKVYIGGIDFSDCRATYDQISTELEDKEIGILVSTIHAGQEFPQFFSDIAHEKLEEMLHASVLAATMMTHQILPRMVERGRGAIVIIGSGLTGSDIPAPQLAVYGAIKAYMDSFAQSLHEEYKGEGITVQTLMPLFVANNKRAMAPDSSNILVPSAASYAKQAIGTLGWSDKSSGCLSHTIQAWMGNIMPTWAAEALFGTLLSLFKQKAMSKLGIEDNGEMWKRTNERMTFDTSFLGPPQLLSLLGNSG